MPRLHFAIALLAMFVLFYLQGSVLDTLGWGYGQHAKSAVTKIHPAIYLYFLAAGVAIFDTLFLRDKFDGLLKSWQFWLYVTAVALLLLKALRVAASGGTAGEQTLVVTTYITPILVLISTTRLRLNQLAIAATLIRVFFVVNSVTAITEVLLRRNFFIDLVNQPSLLGRATAFCGVPLNGALLTGLIIVLLALGAQRTFPKIWRLPELALHGLAMFAFGGRAALLAVLTTLVLGGIVLRRKAGEGRLGPFQRMLPFMVLAVGAVFIMVPPEFVTNSLDRFNLGADKSAATRFAVFKILGALNTHDLMWGASQSYLRHLFSLYESPFGIEAAWFELVAVFGFAVAIPLLAGFVLLLLRLTVRLDRSAKLAILYFLIVTATSLSIGSTSLLISQLLLMLMTIGDRLGLAARAAGQRRRVRQGGAPLARGRPTGDRGRRAAAPSRRRPPGMIARS